MSTVTDYSFFSAGKACFTVDNGRKHYTYIVQKHKSSDIWFVRVFTGSDNTAYFTHYSYLGMFDPALGEIRITAKSRFGMTSAEFKACQWAITQVRDKKTLPDGWHIRHEGRCCKCGRKLTNPESIKAGIGPECAGKTKKVQALAFNTDNPLKQSSFDFQAFTGREVNYD
jgi:hypothetical protein